MIFQVVPFSLMMNTQIVTINTKARFESLDPDKAEVLNKKLALTTLKKLVHTFHPYIRNMSTRIRVKAFAVFPTTGQCVL